MSQRCIIRADFASFRQVQGRKVLQLCMEIPEEEGEAALRILGHPKTGESKWCAIALLNTGTEDGRHAHPIKTGECPVAPATSSSEAKPSGSPKKFHELPLSQQAAIRCGDILFQEFMKAVSNADCAALVRAHCHIQSRAELDHSEAAHLPCQLWRVLEAQYQSWLTDRKFAEARR